jgi:hypothetical protein
MSNTKLKTLAPKPLRACWVTYDSNTREEEVITIYSGKVKKNGFKFRKSGKLYARKSRR